MAKKRVIKEQIEFIVPQYELIAISIVEAKLNALPAPIISPIVGYGHGTGIEVKADEINKHIIILITHNIGTFENQSSYASIKVACFFNIPNFEVFIIKDHIIQNLPPLFVQTLTMIAISTTRGVSWHYLSGTYLQHAVLPLITSEALREHLVTLANSPQE